MKRQTGLLTILAVIGFCALLIGCGGGGGGGGENPVGADSTHQVAGLSGVISFDGQPSPSTGVYLIRRETALAEGIARLASFRMSIMQNVSLDPEVGDFRTLTDAQGNYAFSQVPVGSYNLVAVKDATHQSIKTVIVGEIQTVNVELTPTGNLSGTVILSGVTDLSTTLVYLEGTSYVAVTDAAGAFTLTNLPAATYTIVAARGDAISSGTAVTVSAAVTTPVGVLELTPQKLPTTTGTIQGMVERRVPTPGTYPTVYQTYTPAGTIAHLAGTSHVAVSDATGNYQFLGVPQGNYTIVFPSDVFMADSTPSVTVSPGLTTQASLVTLTLSSSFATPQGTTAFGAILGTVQKSSFLNASDTHSVGVQLTGTNFRSFIYSDPSGSFAFHQVPLGATYNLLFIGGNYTTASATPITVSPASPAAQVGTFRLDPIAVPAGQMPATIVGSITPSLNAANGAYMYLYQAGAAFPHSYSFIGANGDFAFSQVPSGSYELKFDPALGLALQAPGNAPFTVAWNSTVLKPGLTYLNIGPRIDSYTLLGNTLTINGARFVPGIPPAAGSVGRANEAPLTGTGFANWLSTRLIFDVTSLPPGVYTLKVINPDGTYANASTPLTLKKPAPSITTCSVSVPTLAITGANFDQTAIVLANGKPIPVTSITATDIFADLTNLLPGEYQFAVLNPDGTMAFAPTINTIPFASLSFVQTPIPPASYSHSSAQLDWNPVAQADKYHVVRIVGASETFIAETYATSFRVTDLLASTPYTLGVKPLTRTGFMGSTTPTTFTTKSSVFAFIVSNSSVVTADFSGLKANDTGYSYILNGTTSRWYGYDQNLSEFGPSTPIGGGYSMTCFLPGKSLTNIVYGLIYLPSTGPGYINGFSSMAAYTQSPSLGSVGSASNSLTQNLVTNHIVALYDNGGNYYLASLTSGLALVGAVNVGPSGYFKNPEIHMNLDGSKVFVATGTDMPGTIAEYDSTTFTLTRSIQVGNYITDFSASPNNDKFIVVTGEGSPYTMKTFDQNFSQTGLNTVANLSQTQYDHLGRIWMAMDDGNGAYIQVVENGQSYQQPLGVDASFTTLDSLNNRVIAFDSWTKKIIVAVETPGAIIKVLAFDASYLFGE